MGKKYLFRLFLGYIGVYSPPPLNKWIAKLRGVEFYEIRTVWIGIGSLLDNKAPHLIHIGKNVTISNNVNIYTHSQPPTTLAKFGIGYFEKRVEIKSNVYIGSNVTILPGTTINNYSVVGAGSIVTKDVPSYSIVAGNPAVIIRSLTPFN